LNTNLCAVIGTPEVVGGGISDGLPDVLVQARATEAVAARQQTWVTVATQADAAHEVVIFHIPDDPLRHLYTSLPVHFK